MNSWKTENSLMQNKIYLSIQDRIRKGIYKPGEKLSENNLANEFNCSRTPVREAVKTLEQNGLIIIQPKSGTYVKKYTKEELINAIEIRAYLEGLAFTLDVEKKSDISQMKKNLEEMGKLSNSEPFNLEEFGKYHYNFHVSLVNSSGNKFLIDLYNKLHLNALPKIFYSPMTIDDIKQTQAEHEQIVNLIENEDLTGEEFIIHHLMKLRDRFSKE